MQMIIWEFLHKYFAMMTNIPTYITEFYDLSVLGIRKRMMQPKETPKRIKIYWTFSNRNPPHPGWLLMKGMVRFHIAILRIFVKSQKIMILEYQ